MLLQPLEQMFSSPPAAVAVSNRTWAAIPAYLDAEMAAGEATSSRKKAKTAVNGLLRARKLTAENAPTSTSTGSTRSSLSTAGIIRCRSRMERGRTTSIAYVP